MKSGFAILAAAPLLILLASCGEDAATSGEDDAREASGEVLEGSISDDMLAIDQVRSQAPLAAPEPGEGATGTGGSAATASGSEPASGEDPAAAEEAAPAEEPAE